MRVTAEVDRLRRAGVAVLDFGPGEPDFATPDPVKAAAHQAIDANFTRYTPNPGTVELRQAIAARYRADYGVEYSEREVLASAGGKQALFNTALALFGPGDEVILHAPVWPSLVEQVCLAEATPVVVRAQAEDGFAVRAEALLAAVTPQTRGIVINSPCNPTGAVMAEDEFAAVARAARAQGFWLVLDLCYEQLIYGARPHNLPGIANRECRDQTVLCGSASKAYAMTGWRCGWALGPARVIAAAAAIQSHATSNVNSVTQKAVTAALEGPQASVVAMREEYERRRDALCAWLDQPGLLGVHVPEGAFYVFVDVRAVLGPELPSSAALAERLLQDDQVAVTPGEAFDAPGFIRLSYATSMDVLREGSRRLVAFAQRHAGAPAGAR